MAHLAGALGKSVLGSVGGYMPDWRWLVERDNSPWYPTATLFRQRQHDDWYEVLAQVAVELQKFVNTSGATTRFRIARTKCCLS
jgi:hypothetical protein